jgi:hypothetical protein
MSAAGADCRHARLLIGAAPHELPPEVISHLAGCADCSRFRDETAALDGRLRSALELPLAQFRERGPPQLQRSPRRFALAASVVLGLLLVGGLWLLQPQPALAGEVAEHVLHEAGSWDMHDPLPPAAVSEVLRLAGVQFDSSMPVVYAMACPFRGRRVPHLVVQTPAGPLTVMLLAHEKVSASTEFSEQGYRGVLLPAGSGAVAVLSRAGAVPAGIAAEIAGSVR